MSKSVKKVREVCVLCMVERAEARVDQAKDAVKDMMMSGAVGGGVVIELDVRLEEAGFWASRLAAGARQAGAKHGGTACPT